MKRLLLVNISLGAGGAERQLVHLARHLDRSRWAVTALLLGGKGAFLKDVPPDVSVVTFSNACPSGGLRRVPWGLRQGIALRRFLRAQDYDVILTFLWFPALLCALALAGQRNRPKLVWSLQSDLEQHFSHKPVGWLRWLPVQAILPGRVDHFVAVSGGVGRSLQRAFSISAGEMRVIPNAIDLQQIAQMKDEAHYPAKLPGRLRVVSVGRLHAVKGYTDLLGAIAQVKDHLPAFEVFILGEGPERPRLERLIRETGLDHQVQLAGAVDNPYAWLRSADLFVSASHWETFGIALVEAMALGLPVITTATDGAKDIVAPGVDGVLVPVGDTGALSQALLELARSPERRAALGQKAREKAQRFDARLVAAQYQALLDQVLAE